MVAIARGQDHASAEYVTCRNDLTQHSSFFLRNRRPGVGVHRAVAWHYEPAYNIAVERDEQRHVMR